MLNRKTVLTGVLTALLGIGTALGLHNDESVSLVSENASVSEPASLLAIHVAEDGAVVTKPGNAK